MLEEHPWALKLTLSACEQVAGRAKDFGYKAESVLCFILVGEDEQPLRVSLEGRCPSIPPKQNISEGWRKIILFLFLCQQIVPEKKLIRSP